MTNANRRLLSVLLLAVMMLSLVAPVLPTMKASAATPANITPLEVQQAQSAANDDLTVGILSDIHISDHFGEGVQLNRLKKALLFLKSQDVDAIVIAGDLQEYSSADQLETSQKYMGQIVAAWQEIFPAAKGEAGYVEPIFIYGNHDTNMTEAGWWPEELGTFSAAYTKTVNGYTFVAANHHRTPQTAGPAAAAPLLESAVAGNPDKPVFYIQHSWVGDTVPGWGYGDGEAAYARTMLAPYHNVVAFTGHTHVPLTDEKSIWQGDGGNDGQYTVINAATTNYSGLSSSDLSVNSYAGSANETEHGMVMHVKGSRVSVDRYSFNDMSISGTTISGDAVKIGETWSWDACDATDRPYAYDNRYETANAPSFAANAVLTAGSITDTSATVTVPAATLQPSAGYSDMIEHYIVEACNPTTGEVEAYKKIATSHHIDDKADVYQDSYTVTVSSLKPGVNYTLKAYAVEFFGKRSAPISLNITTTGARTYYRVGDVDLNGNIDAQDMTALQEILANPSDYNELADVDGNGINETRDITALQAKLDAVVITYPDSGDLLDRVSHVTLTNVGTSDSYQPVAYGTGIETGVVNGDSNQSVKTWTTNRIGWANTTVYFTEPVDLSGYTHLTFDALFENEYTVADSYLKRFLGVTLISGYQEQKASVGSMNFDQGCKGWDTKTISLAGLKNIDLTAVTGIRFGHNFEYYEGRFDGVTEHAIYWDNLRGLVLEGKDSDMLASSTVTGGSNIFGSGYTNNTNVAIESTGGTLDIIWTSEKIINNYAAFTVDMRTPVKTTVNVQPIDASGNLLGNAVPVESCNIYQNKDILTSGFGLADDAVAAGLRFTYTCASLLLDNMNARGAKDYDLIGTASRVEAIGGEKLTMVLTTEGTNGSNNAIYAYAMPYTGVWGGGAKLVFDEPLDLSQNHYLRYDVKIVNNHRDLYLKLYDAAGELIADYGTLRIHQSISDGTGAYVTYEIDLLGGGAVTAEQLKNVGAIQFTSNMHSDSNYDSNGNVNNNAYNDPNAPRQIWIDNVYAVNPAEDILGAYTSLIGPSAVQDGFVCEIMPTTTDGRTNVLHWFADPENGAGTTSNWPGETSVTFNKDVVKHNAGSSVSYDYFEFTIKNVGNYVALTFSFKDAAGNTLGSSNGEYRVSLEEEWTTYRLDLASAGLTAESISKIASISIGWNWQYQNANGDVAKKIADIYIDNMGFRCYPEDTADKLDMVGTIRNSEWWYGSNNTYPGAGWLYQSDVTVDSDSAFMFYRSAHTNGMGYSPRILYAYFSEPIQVSADWTISIDVINQNFAKNSRLEIIGSDDKAYICFSFSGTDSYTLSANISDLVTSDGSVFDPATVSIKGVKYYTNYNRDSSVSEAEGGYLVLDNLIIGEPAQPPVEPETIEEDWIKLPIDSGACYGTAAVDTEHTYGDSREALKYSPTGVHYFAFNTEAAFNNGNLSSIDLTGGTLSWYVYFGEQEAKGQICLGNKGSYTGEPYVTYTAVGDGWYKTEVVVDELASAGIAKNVTRLYLYFPAGYTVWIDQLTFTAAQQPEDDQDFLYNATINNGVKQSEVTNNSSIAWKITPTATGWTYPTFTFAEEVNITGCKLVMDIKPVNMTNFRMNRAQINGQWCETNSIYYTVDTWTTVELALSSDFTTMKSFALGIEVLAAEGVTDYALYIDNVRLVKEDTGDLLSNTNSISYNVDHWIEANGLSCGVENAEVFGDNSIRSWRFSATSEANMSAAVAQLHLQKNYDLTGAYLAYDIKFVSSDAADILSVGIRPDDSGWAAMAKTIYTNVAAGDWRTVVLDFNNSIESGQTLTDLMLVTFYFDFSSTTGAERTVYIDNLRIVPGVESFADDEIHMNVDTGSTGVKYWLSDRYTYGENSTVSMFIWADSTNNNGLSKGEDMYYSPESGKNTIFGGNLPDYSHGVLSGYFYFGEQEPFASWNPVYSGWKGTLPNNFHFKDLGDGWYLGTVNAATIYTNSDNNPFVTGETIRSSINFNAGAKVYLDNLHFLANDTVEEDWTNMSMDSGATNGDYRMDTEITYGDSKASLYFQASTGTNLVFNPQSATDGRNARLAACDITGSVVTWYVYFGQQEATGSIRFVDTAWKTVNTAVSYEGMGDGWYQGSVNTSELSYPDGFDTTKIIRIYLQFTKGGEYYVDMMSLTAPKVNVLTDMIANSTAFKGPTAVQENFTSGILDTTEDGRTNVAYASAVTDNGLTNSNWPGELKITFPVTAADVDTTVYDYLEFDYKNTGVKYALYVTICDADGNKLGTSGEIRATNVCDWTTHRIDLTTMGLTADELKLAAQIWFSVSWEYNNSTGTRLQAGAIYFDNARFGSVTDESNNLLDRVVRTKVSNGTANTSYTNAGAYFDAEGGAGSSGWYTQQLYFDAPITVAAGTTISADFLNTGFHHGYSISLIGSDGKNYSSIAPNADGDQSKTVAIESFVSSGVAFDPATVTIVGIHISFSFGTCHSNPDSDATLTIKHLTIVPAA